MRVNREELLKTLESCQPGLSPREIVEQSKCYVLSKGRVSTYNDEICCRSPSGLGKELTGAVQGDRLLEVLRQLPEEEVTVEQADGELHVAGKGKGTFLRMEAEILLPVSSVERPAEADWKALPPEFGEAVGTVAACSSRKANETTTFVHIGPKFVEGTDAVQLCRWRIKTGFSGPALVRHSSIAHIVHLGMNSFAEGESWVHFRNPSGLVLSCRRFVEKFPDCTLYLKDPDGAVKASLPTTLAEALKFCETFSRENAEENAVLVKLKPGGLRVEGHGISGRSYWSKKCRYDGKPMEFMIAPQILADVVKRNPECLVSAERLKVDSGSYQYVTVLGAVGERDGEAAEEGGDE